MMDGFHYVLLASLLVFLNHYCLTSGQTHTSSFAIFPLSICQYTRAVHNPKTTGQRSRELRAQVLKCPQDRTGRGLC